MEIAELDTALARDTHAGVVVDCSWEQEHMLSMEGLTAPCAVSRTVAFLMRRREAVRMVFPAELRPARASRLPKERPDRWYLAAVMHLLAWEGFSNNLLRRAYNAFRADDTPRLADIRRPYTATARDQREGLDGAPYLGTTPDLEDVAVTDVSAIVPPPANRSSPRCSSTCTRSGRVAGSVQSSHSTRARQLPSKGSSKTRGRSLSSEA